MNDDYPIYYSNQLFGYWYAGEKKALLSHLLVYPLAHSLK